MSNGSSILESAGDSEEIEIGLVADDPAIDQTNSASTTCESGHGPILIVPVEEPPAEIVDTEISARIMPPTELLTNLNVPGRVEESPELSSV